jgi:hypothetical protein
LIRAKGGNSLEYTLRRLGEMLAEQPKAKGGEWDLEACYRKNQRAQHLNDSCACLTQTWQGFLQIAVFIRFRRA